MSYATIYTGTCGNTNNHALIRDYYTPSENLIPQNFRNRTFFLKGLFLGVSKFFNWYSILLIRLRRFRIFFQNQSSVLRSRASNLLIIGGEFYSQKREIGTKRGLSIYFIYFCPGMGKDLHYLYLQGWWLYKLAQQVIFSPQVDKNNRILTHERIRHDSWMSEWFLYFMGV